jgi:hypothetical protein
LACAEAGSAGSGKPKEIVMNKRSLRNRLAATALALGAFAGAGVVLSTSASAWAPEPPPGDCVHRQVTEHNGYFFECYHGAWVWRPLGDERAMGGGTSHPVKPVAPGQHRPLGRG